MPIPKKEKEITKFKVANIEIEIGKKYILDNKFDASAPLALQKMDATKYPFNGSGSLTAINFDTKRNTFDTGFDKQSFCLSKYTLEEKETLVPLYNKLIREPFEKAFNVDLDSNKNSEFWNEFKMELKVNREFNTNDPLELMELFQTIIQGMACEKGEKNPFYRQNAQYIVSNPTFVKNKQKEKTKIRKNAIKRLNLLIDGDRDKLNLILEFMGRDNVSKVTAEDLEDTYFEVFNQPEQGVKVAEEFVNICDFYETSKGKEQMEFFYAISALLRLRKIQKTNRGYETLEGTYLGINLKGASEFCLQPDSVQRKAIEQLIDENPIVRREV